MALEINEQLLKIIDGKKNILITFHQSGAGDVIGSALALLLFLEKMDMKAEIICPDFNLPAGYSFLRKSVDIKQAPGHLQKFIVTVDINATGIQELSYDVHNNKLRIFITPKQGYLTREHIKTAESDFVYDLIFVLGTPDLDSLGSVYTRHMDFFSNIPIVNLDTNSANEHYGHINVIDITKSSVSELLLTLLEDMKPEYITEDIATAMLTGMIAKTHSFTKGNIRPTTLQAASRLVELGADRDHIIKNLYQTKSIATFKLWGTALSHLQHDDNIGLVWTALTREDFSRSGANHTELTSIIDELIVNSPSAELILLFYEQSDVNGKTFIQGILKSTGVHNATKILDKYMATGNSELAMFTLNESLKEAENTIINHIKKEIE